MQSRANKRLQENSRAVTNARSRARRASGTLLHALAEAAACCTTQEHAPLSASHDVRAHDSASGGASEDKQVRLIP